MKKLLLLALSSVLLAACSDPKEILLTQASDIEKNAEKIQKLSDEEKKLLVGYVFRAEAGSIFGQSSQAAYGITVGKAIENQKKFIEDQKAKEAATKAAEEKARKELEIQRAKLNDAINVIFVSHEFIKGEYSFQDKILFNIKFINNSGKNITGTKGVTIFSDKFGDVIKRIELKNDFNENGGKLEAGKEFTFVGNMDVNQFINEDVKLAETPTSDLKFTYEPETVLFEDGTKLEAK